MTAKIGDGGLGEVYRVRDTTLDLDVALRVDAESRMGPAAPVEAVGSPGERLADLFGKRTLLAGAVVLVMASAGVGCSQCAGGDEALSAELLGCVPSSVEKFWRSLC